MARKARKKASKQKKVQTDLTLADYQFPGEKMAYWQGLILMFVPFIALSVGLAAVVFGNSASALSSPIHGQWWLPIEFIAWPLLSIPVLNYLAVRPRREELKKAGPQARVLTKTHPELKAMLAEQARLLSIPEPEMYVVADDAAYAWAMPGKTPAILISQPVLDTLNGPEVAAVLARQMGHIKSHHVKVAQAVTYYRHANPAWKLMLFPAGIFIFSLRNWLEIIEYTADRVAVLVTGRGPVVNAALAKLAVAADKQADVTPKDLEAYMNAGTDISSDGEQMQLHFRVGTFLATQKGLRERVEQVTEFPNLDQGKRAMEKIALAREKRG